MTSSTLMKWVGGATAILTLLFGLQRVVTSVSDARVKRNRTSESVRAARLQLADRRYDEAWSTLQQAEAANSTAGDVRAEQEDVAMECSRNAVVRRKAACGFDRTPGLGGLPPLERRTRRASARRPVPSCARPRLHERVCPRNVGTLDPVAARIDRRSSVALRRRDSLGEPSGSRARVADLGPDQCSRLDRQR
jgi:hypothetical protein